MRDRQQLKVLKKAAQREDWSSVGAAFVELSNSAAGNPADRLRVEILAPEVRTRNRKQIVLVVNGLLELQG